MTNSVPARPRLLRSCAIRVGTTFQRAALPAVIVITAVHSAEAGVPGYIRNHGLASVERSHVVDPHGRLRVRVHALGRTLDLALEPSPVLAAGAETITVDEYGEHREPSKPVLFHGALADDPSATVRVALTDTAIIGSITDAGDTWFFEPLRRFDRQAREDATIAYRLSDIDESAIPPGSCAAGEHAAPPSLLATGTASFDVTTTTSSSGFAETDFATEFAAEAASGPIELSVVADSQFYARHGANSAAYMQVIIDQVAAFYPASIGMSVSIVQTVVYTSPGVEPLTSSTASGTLLTSLAQARTSQPAVLGAGDITHLFTGRDLDSSIIGIAYVGTVCDRSYAASIAQDFNSSLHMMTLLAGHELGHSLGASHDGQSGSPCSGTAFGYVMWPTLTSSLAENFSTCSRNTIAPVLAEATCLGGTAATTTTTTTTTTTLRLTTTTTLSPTTTTTTLPPPPGTCGNGVVEAGEECDDNGRTGADCCRSDCRLDTVGTICIDDGNICTADICGAGGYCLHPDRSATCSAGDACTTEGQCSNGTCVSTETVKPILSPRLKVRFGKGTGDDVLSVRGVVGAGLLSPPSASGVTIRFLDDGGGLLREAIAPAQAWINRNNAGRTFRFAPDATLQAQTGGLSSMLVRYRPSSAIARVKAKFTDTELPFLEGRNSVGVQVLIGDSASGDCGTTLALQCRISGGLVSCM